MSPRFGGIPNLLQRRILRRRSRRPPLMAVFSGPGALRSYASAPAAAVWTWHRMSLPVSRFWPGKRRRSRASRSTVSSRSPTSSVPCGGGRLRRRLQEFPSNSAELRQRLHAISDPVREIIHREVPRGNPDDRLVLIEIETSLVLRGVLPRRALAVVEEWCKLPRPELRAAWDSLHRGTRPDKLAPLERPAAMAARARCTEAVRRQRCGLGGTRSRLRGGAAPAWTRRVRGRGPRLGPRPWSVPHRGVRGAVPEIDRRTRRRRRCGGARPRRRQRTGRSTPRPASGSRKTRSARPDSAQRPRRGRRRSRLGGPGRV